MGGTRAGHAQACPRVVMSIETKIAWVAGFIEGEGCISFRQGASLCVSQVQKFPLEYLNSVVGGKIYKAMTPAGKPMFRHCLFGAHAVSVLMSIYCLMSPKKQSQIRNVIRKWKKQPGRQRHATLRPRHPNGTYL